MAVRTNLTQTCDRCLKPFNERHLKAGQEVPTIKQKGLVLCETTMTNKDSEPETKVLFNFEDTCPDCQKAIKPLIEKLKLEGGKKKRKKASATSTKKSRKGSNAAESKSNGKSSESKSQVPEYNEESKQEAEPKPDPKEEPTAKTQESEQSEEERELIEDPETGDKYDAKTGEIVEQRVREEGNDAPDSEGAAESGAGETQEKDKARGDEDHPF